MATRSKRVPRGRRISDPRADRVFMAFTYVGLFILTLSVLYPLVFVISASFSSGDALAAGKVWLFPVGFNADAYRTVWEAPRIVGGFINSGIYTVVGAAVGTALTLLVGFVLARDDLPFRRPITFFFLIPTLFSAGIIPTYLVVRDLGLLNTRWAVILPGAVSVFNIIITRTFFKMNIPNEMLEAARMDGASDFGFFVRIALPLSKPIIAVNLLFYAIAQWNGWFNAFLYLNNSDLYPLQLVLRDVLAESKVNPADMGDNLKELVRRKELFDKLKYALIVVAMAPPLIAYPFVQKHFVKGALIGSLK